MKIIIGLLMGFCSGFLIYMGAFLLFHQSAKSFEIFPVIFVVAWFGSTFIIVNGAQSLSRVFSRGFLIGTAEWLAMIPAGIIYSGKSINEVGKFTSASAALAGATFGAGLISFITSGIALAMALACFLAFGVSYFLGREMQKESLAPTRKCPDCAELIQAEAKKCRYCGAIIK